MPVTTQKCFWNQIEIWSRFWNSVNVLQSTLYNPTSCQLVGKPELILGAKEIWFLTEMRVAGNWECLNSSFEFLFLPVQHLIEDALSSLTLVWRRFYISPAGPLDHSRAAILFQQKKSDQSVQVPKSWESSSFQNKELLSWGPLQFHWSAGLEIARYLLSANNLIWYIGVCIYRPIPFF